MKKIFFYINTLGHGGAERVISNLAAEFSDSNDCILITSFPLNNEYDINDNINRVNLYNDRVEGNFIKRNIKLLIRLRRLIKNQKPDVLISFMAEPNFRSILACLGTKTKSIISIRNDPSKEYPNILFKICAKVLYLFANGIVFQTKDAQSWFSKIIRNKSEIIYNAVNDKFYNVQSPSDRRDIVSVGRLEKQKNHVMLIKAFYRIKDKINENLIIYGEGNERDNIEQLIHSLNLSQRVFLPGTINNVPEIVNKSKMFVLSSDYEGMPNALMEAMAMGVPCISTDCPCGGPKELFDNNKNGILVPIGDVDLLSKYIVFLIENVDEYNKYSKNALLKAESFKSDVVYKHWNEYVMNILNIQC